MHWRRFLVWGIIGERIVCFLRHRLIFGSRFLLCSTKRIIPFGFCRGSGFLFGGRIISARTEGIVIGGFRLRSGFLGVGAERIVAFRRGAPALRTARALAALAALTALPTAVAGTAGTAPAAARGFARVAAFVAATAAAIARAEQLHFLGDDFGRAGQSHARHSTLRGPLSPPDGGCAIRSPRDTAGHDRPSPRRT